MTDPKTVNLLVIRGRLTPAQMASVKQDVDFVEQELNRLQDAFRFVAFEYDPLANEPADKAGYELAEYVAGVNEFLVDRPNEYCVAVCDGRLGEKAWFNYQEGDVGLVSILAWEKYTPPGIARRQYILYLVLCSTLLVHCKGFTEHTQKHACLFDRCDDPNDITDGLRKAYIHEDCRTHLIQDYKFSRKTLDGFHAVLRQVRRRQLFALATSQTSATARSFWLGIGAAFVVNVIAAESPTWGIAISWAISLTVTAWWLAAKNQERLMVKDGRRLRWLGAIAFLALLGAGLFLVVGPADLDSGAHLDGPSPATIPTTTTTGSSPAGK